MMIVFGEVKHMNPASDWIDHINPEQCIFKGRAYRFVKRVMDLSIVILASPGWLMVIGLIALVNKFFEPSAPVFFVQQRTGKGGKRFNMIKFRTMVPNAEDLKGQLAETNVNGELAGPLKMKNDPRVTRLGRILRKTSLDELPQLFNVLRGDMSLVGPRPTSWSLKSYKLWHTERLDVLPGITGLWQIYARGNDDFDEWLRWDIRYLEKQCISVDFQILVRTFLVALQQRGAL